MGRTPAPTRPMVSRPGIRHRLGPEGRKVRLRAISLNLALVLGLVACGGGGSSTTKGAHAPVDRANLPRATAGSSRGESSPSPPPPEASPGTPRAPPAAPP